MSEGRYGAVSGVTFQTLVVTVPTEVKEPPDVGVYAVVCNDPSGNITPPADDLITPLTSSGAAGVLVPIPT
jgi:hypothetical protein